MTSNDNLDPMARWRGRNALVTGASSGSGAAIARALAGAGLRVVLAARRLERLEQMRAELTAGGAEALAVRLDLADEESIKAMYDRVQREWGGVDLVVNNAGVAFHGSIAEGNSQEWRDMANINFVGFSICLREAVAAVADRPEGMIINISSLAAYRINPAAGISFYGASKHAMRAMVDGLRGELALKGSPIRLGMISPGLMDTEVLARAMPEDKFGLDPSDRNRFLDPASIADAVLFMMSTQPHVQIHDIIMRAIGQPT